MDVKPWHQQPGEHDGAFRAFLIYRDLGPHRTIVAVQAAVSGKPVEQFRKANGTITAWSTKWHWVDRVRAWEAHLQAERDEAAARTAAEEGAELERRMQRRLRERLADSDTLKEQYKRMIAFPLQRSRTERTVHENGHPVRQTIVVNPVRWNARDPLRYLKMSMEMEDWALARAFPGPEGDGTPASSEPSEFTPEEEAELQEVLDRIASRRASVNDARHARGGGPSGPGADLPDDDP